VVFYLVPGVLGQLAKTAWFTGTTGAVLHYALALASFALTIWGFVDIGLPARHRGLEYVRTRPAFTV
jgi:hypothetical protein